MTLRVTLSESGVTLIGLKVTLIGAGGDVDGRKVTTNRIVMAVGTAGDSRSDR
jgi:hypothetical protein